jgi:lipooligosaccharide transport system permease protein
VTPLVAVLVGLAVAAPMFAYSATVESPNAMAIMFRFGMLPMMLFSGVFFPVEQLPGLLQPLAHALPLWHGVELSRAATLGLETAWPAALHVGYLGLWFVVGFALALTRFRKRLAV